MMFGIVPKLSETEQVNKYINKRMLKFLKKIRHRLNINSEVGSSLNLEYNRLLKQPRFHKGNSTIWGFPMDYVDACTYLVGGEEIFKKNIYQFEATNDAPLIIDCGANIGLSVLYFNKLFPDSEIIAFEPDPHIFKVLKENIKYNKCKNIQLFQKAIWIDSNGVKFNLEGGFSGRIPKSEEENNVIMVESISLREFIDRPVDFLKIDIEGAENKVVFDIATKLHFVKNIFIEFHSHINEEQNLGEILTLLKNEGFRYTLHEAFVNKRPYVDRETMLGMDLQMNLYGFRP